MNLVCASCSSVNRVPEERIADKPVCGKCKRALLSTAPIDLEESTFAKFIGRNDLPVLVDFWAPWCQPCRAMAPEFSKAANQLSPKVILAKLDTESNPRPAAPFNITGIPTMIMFKGGKEVARQSGALNAQQIIQFASQA